MKKTPRKLVLRSETFRTLNNTDLSRAVGGFDSGAVQCPVAADSGAFQCPAPAVGAATAACG